jgi:hypothetical protein
MMGWRLGVCFTATIVLLSAWAESQAAPPIDPHRSLLITDPAVVADPERTVDPCDGSAKLPVWSFGHLVSEMAAQRPDLTAQEFARQWLTLFGTPQTVNGQTVAPRNVDAVLLKPWEETGFDLARLPFRLLAIVNRVDLRRGPLQVGDNAGEVRFIFGAVDLRRQCRPLRFAVIVEYGVRKKGCSEVRGWARQWAALSQLDPSDPRYRSALEKLTGPLVVSNPTISRPNHSWLDQVRTNEADLGTDGVWEMREFRIDRRKGTLRQDPLSMTPRADLNSTPALGRFLSSITPELNQHDYEVPRSFPLGTPFLGAVARLPNADVFWDAPNYNNKDTRHFFSLNTCTGCHGRETNTSFVHIDPRTGALSDFLSGTSVADPKDPSIVHPFAELEQRRRALDVLIRKGCSG